MLTTLNQIFLRLRTILGLVLVASSTTNDQAHEFWIDPVAFAVARGDPIIADIRVGQNYEGASHAYFPRNFRVFDLAQGDVRTAVEGRLGDRPALTQTTSGQGLAVVLHVTSDSRLTYKEFEKFRDFVTHKDAEWVLASHADRGLPETGFGEVYSRYAKSLVAVGTGVGRDQAYGLETEFVIGANPYTDDVSGGVPVSLFYKGAPRGDAQIEVFEKDAAGAVRVFTVRTNEDGQAVIPVRAGHRYMLDAVVLRQPAPALSRETNSVWESLWANLTFEVPAR